MAIRSKSVEYRDDGKGFEACISWDDSVAGVRPGILVSHTWAGLSDFELNKARQLAELGYAGFALDLYGKGVLGHSVREKQALMQPYMDDRELLQRRMQLAVRQMSAEPIVDPSRIAAIGFCFGGLCVLDLARCGADIRGVASFHGLLAPPGNTDGTRIRAKVLVMHGWDDPMARPDQLASLAGELTESGADWQIHAYGNTMHAFTNPAAGDASLGTVYQADAARRSWLAMRNFMAEILA